MLAFNNSNNLHNTPVGDINILQAGLDIELASDKNEVWI